MSADRQRFDPAALEQFGAALVRASGLSEEAASVTARLLVEAEANGMPLYPIILPSLQSWAERYGIALPEPRR